MARPKQTGLTYFPLDTGIFSDRRIKKLLLTFGGKGFMIYLFVLCDLYKENGYFARCEDGFITDVSFALNIPESTVKEVIVFCVNNALFDKCVYDAENVLTSHGIQQRYLSVKSRSNATIDPRYLVKDINAAETGVIAYKTKSGINAAITPIIATETPINATITTINAAEIPIKENILKEKIKNKKENSDCLSKGFSYLPTDSQQHAAAPTEFQRLQEVDKLIADFKSEQVFCEYCCQNYAISPTELLNYFDKFLQFLHATDIHQRSRKDCKTHFLNWLARSVQRQRAEIKPAPTSIEPTQQQIERVVQLFPDCNGYAAKAFKNYISDHQLSPEKGLQHFERAYQNGMKYGNLLLRVQTDKVLLFKD